MAYNVTELQGRLRRTHGSLMIIAWFTFITAALISARYFRRHWLNKRPCGLNIWFLLHRSLNYCGILLMFVGLVCELSSRDWTWAGPRVGGGAYNSSAFAIHSLCGLLCIIMCWAQPLAALLRCSTTSSRRPIYNWFHRIAGIIAWLLAMTTIIIAAANFPYFSSNSAALALVITFIVCLLIAVGIGETSAFLERRHAFRGTRKISSIRRSHSSFDESTFENRMQNIRTMAFSGFGVVSIIIVIALITLIALSKHNTIQKNTLYIDGLQRTQGARKRKERELCCRRQTSDGLAEPDALYQVNGDYRYTADSYPPALINDSLSTAYVL